MSGEESVTGGDGDPELAPPRSGSAAALAGLGHAVIGGVLLFQLFADWVGGLAGAVGAGLVGGLLWSGFIAASPRGVPARAAIVGAIALLVACLAARFTPWAVAATAPPSVLLFSLWIVLPVGVAAAVGLALAIRRFGR
jgi:hypothetical protein